MADNYIERQYEQYEARKAAWEKARKLGKKKVKALRQRVLTLTMRHPTRECHVQEPPTMA